MHHAEGELQESGQEDAAAVLCGGQCGQAVVLLSTLTVICTDIDIETKELFSNLCAHIKNIYTAVRTSNK